MFIPDPGFEFFFHPGSRISDPQPWTEYHCVAIPNTIYLVREILFANIAFLIFVAPWSSCSSPDLLRLGKYFLFCKILWNFSVMAFEGVTQIFWNMVCILGSLYWRMSQGCLKTSYFSMNQFLLGLCLIAFSNFDVFRKFNKFVSKLPLFLCINFTLIEHT